MNNRCRERSYQKSFNRAEIFCCNLALLYNSFSHAIRQAEQSRKVLFLSVLAPLRDFLKLSVLMLEFHNSRVLCGLCDSLRLNFPFLIQPRHIISPTPINGALHL